MRCFVSIELPENVRAEIFHVFEKLQKSGLCNGNFVEKDNLHLTLKFLGDLSEEEVERANMILSRIEFKQFPIETRGVGFFPDKDYVKVIYVELNSEGLVPLKNLIESELEKAGFGRDKKVFEPHLTVARIKSVRNKKEFVDFSEKIRMEKKFFIAEDFCLMKSNLLGKGSSPEYKILGRYGMRIRG